ncbi:MAG: PQQ-binding-like beta-propeller repeat protein [Thermoleophilia bacterium]
MQRGRRGRADRASCRRRDAWPSRPEYVPIGYLRRVDRQRAERPAQHVRARIAGNASLVARSSATLRRRLILCAIVFLVASALTASQGATVAAGTSEPASVGPPTVLGVAVASGEIVLRQRLLPSGVPRDDGQAIGVVSGHTVFVASFGLLRAVDLGTGRELWRRRGRVALDHDLQVAGGLLLVDRSDYGLTALDAETGHLRWRLPSSGIAEGDVRPVAGSGIVYVPEHRHGVVRALDLKTGRTRWRVRMGPNGPDATPRVAAVRDGIVAVMTVPTAMERGPPPRTRRPGLSASGRALAD